MNIVVEARALSHPQPGGYKSYTTNLLHQLAVLDPTDQYHLYIDRPITDDRLMGLPNVILEQPHPSLGGMGVVVREQVQLLSYLKAKKPDVVHCPCGTGPIAYDGPLVVTLHDAIEYLEPYPPLSLSPQSLRRAVMKAYTRTVQHRLAERAARVITDSEYSKQDLVRILGLKPEKIIPIPIAPAQRFKPITDEKVLTEVRTRLKLPDQFVLAIASASPRKNIDGLIRGYAQLEAGLQEQAPLIIIWTHGYYQGRISELTHRYHLDRSIRFLSQVGDDDLVALYNLATLFVMPSLYEGFGLPVLEAMACGTPVICSNRTSLPEVAGEVGVMVNPEDPEELARKMAELLADPPQRAILREAGLIHAKQFSWETTARRTYDVYRSLAGNNVGV